MKRLLVVGVALAAMAVEIDFTTPADAADMVTRPARRAAPAARAPAAQPAQSNWTGGQAGGQGGGSSGSQSFVDPPFICPTVGTCPVSPFSFSGSPASFTGGGFLGYRVQMGGMVVGVESDVSYKKLETSYSQSTGPSSLLGGTRTEFFHGSIKQGWDASFRVRGGYLITPWTLAYITGGLAIGEVSGTSTYLGTFTSGLIVNTASVNASWNDTRVGGTVGAGLETAIAFGLKARVEYRYTDFGKYSKSVPVSTTCTALTCLAASTSTIDLHPAFHKVTAGIGFDF